MDHIEPKSFNSLAAFLRRPVVGPVVFGIVFGGIPFGIVFSRLTGRVVSPESLGFMLVLTPVAVIVATIGAVLGASRRWQVLMARALLTSIFACVPLPTLVWAIVVFNDLGTEGILNPRNLPFFALIIAFWTAAVTVLACLFAVIFTLVKYRQKPADTNFAA